MKNDGDTGCTGFVGGDRVVPAQDDTLVLRIEAADEESRTRLEGVAGRHLERLMLREPPNLAWTPVRA